MDKGPVDIVEDDLNRVVKLEPSFIGGKSKLISCSDNLDSLLPPQVTSVLG